MSYDNPLTYAQIKSMPKPRLLAYYKKHGQAYFFLQHPNGDFDGRPGQRAFYDEMEMVKYELDTREHVG